MVDKTRQEAGRSHATRILLDTNAWKEVIDADEVQKLRSLSKSEGLPMLIAPAVVYEMLRTKRPDLKKRLVKTATLGYWTRLMPDVFTAAADVVAVLRDRRPRWMRVVPDLASYHRERADWAAPYGFWKRARDNPQATAAMLERVEGDLFVRARRDATERRESMSHLHFENMVRSCG